MPIDYTKYNNNWFTVIRPAILKRAKNKCEICGVVNKSKGYREKNGQFITADNFVETWATAQGIRIFTIVLSVAHIDHNIDNNDYSNLLALCQKHHLLHDQHQHIMSRKINAANQKKLL